MLPSRTCSLEHSYVLRPDSSLVNPHLILATSHLGGSSCEGKPAGLADFSFPIALAQLPVSHSHGFRVAGTQTAAGYVDWVGETEDEESEKRQCHSLSRQFVEDQFEQKIHPILDVVLSNSVFGKSSF